MLGLLVESQLSYSLVHLFIFCEQNIILNRNDYKRLQFRVNYFVSHLNLLLFFSTYLCLFFFQSSVRFSRHTSKYSISEILNDEIHTDILQFCLYSNSKSLIIIPSPLKFYSKLYHHLLNNKSSSSSQLSASSTSTISSMKGTFMNTGLLCSSNIFIEYPPWQRNLLHVKVCLYTYNE